MISLTGGHPYTLQRSAAELKLASLTACSVFTPEHRTRGQPAADLCNWPPEEARPKRLAQKNAAEASANGISEKRCMAFTRSLCRLRKGHCGTFQAVFPRVAIRGGTDRQRDVKQPPMPISKRRVAIYARVSTHDKGQDPENQLLQLRACRA